MYKKKVILLRGVSGSGKSSFAKFIKELYPMAEICSADDYWLENGNYNFRPLELQKAHAACQCKFYDALEGGKSVVIVDNTNTSEGDLKIYMDLAKDFNYNVINLVVENRHGNKSIHSVPIVNLLRQEIRLRDSIKLA